MLYVNLGSLARKRESRSANLEVTYAQKNKHEATKISHMPESK